MVIRKMNSVFVKHGRWFFGGFTLLIIVSFVWFFTPGLSGNIFFDKQVTPSTAVGKFMGEKITHAEIMSCADALALAMAVSYNQSPANSAFRDYARENAFETICKLRAAKRMGISVSDSAVADYIKAMPAFRGENGFDLKKFETYKEKALKPAGYDASDLDAAVRDLLALMQIDRAAASEAIVTPDEVKQAQLSNGEKFDVRVARFHAKDFEKEVPITEEALMSFYTVNKNLFILPPKFKAEVVRFNYVSYEKDAAAQVSDAVVKAYYDKNQAEFKKGDATTPFAEAAPKIRKKLAEALAKELAMKDARKLRDALYEATSESTDANSQADAFKRVAKERSLEIYETGWFDSSTESLKNIGKEPLLVDSLASANKRYPISKAMAGSRAAFVALLVDKKDAEPGEFNEVKAKVEELCRSAKAISIAREKATDAALKISEAKSPASLLDSLAVGKVKFEKLPSFTQMTPPSCPDVDDVMELATATQPGKLAKTKETADGALLVFVDARTPMSGEELEKGRAQAETLFKQRKQGALVDSFRSWIAANSENYMARDERKRK